MSNQMFHICISISGTLAMRPEEFAQSFQGVFYHDDGRPMTLTEAHQAIEAEQAKGRKIIPAQGCDNFSYESGCLGHTQEVAT